ncbi:MAG: hypothetical protein WAN11_15590, partial [Syntrophobacteraceae bacterium]
GFYTQVLQRVCKLADSLFERHIVVAFYIPVDNFIAWSDSKRSVQNVFDQKGLVISRRGPVD